MQLSMPLHFTPHCTPLVGTCIVPGSDGVFFGPGFSHEIRAQLLHGSARPTQAVRRSIQRSQESLQTLAKRHGLKPKTVAKWRKRATTMDAPMGPTHT